MNGSHQDYEKKVSHTLKSHYYNTFVLHGPTPKGVDWNKADDLELRYKKMLDVLNSSSSKSCSLLDVGCGYGGLFEYATQRSIKINYYGIDLCENMIEYAQRAYPNAGFMCGDVMLLDSERYDYVVCNGILTQKLDVSILAMESYARELIKKMFMLSMTGVAFNVMTNKVNYMTNNLYYKSPVELLNFCLDEISPNIKLDHSYGLYEYTMYLYR